MVNTATKKQKTTNYSSKTYSTYRRPLLISIILIIALVGSVVVLFNYMLNYTPAPKEFPANITFETYSNFFYNFEVMRCHSEAEVTHVEPEQERIGIGVVTDPWNLKFGSMPLGSGSSRYVELANLGERDAKIIFRSYGNISRYVGFSENNFIMHPKDNVTIKVTFHPSVESGAIGNFSGEIDRIVQIPKYDFLYMFW